MTATCDCLTQYDATLPHAGEICPLADPDTKLDTLRELAELAAYKDIGAALIAYRQLTR
ncbi:hypothetical protein SEA_TYPHA_116 [Mycobacterium phage Typha]|uniref:Uncharacterized protein n=1 Tax=Mycobacterium phage Typha TaxID=2517971 RepID=A0A482JCR9_9CAUD|nr:hypothetical protein KCH40_gp053 [Mycobacterium phage Typha]QBP29771.1 hypothetical protein SEA_TYPHA_116 [Mycobacterium phage Typha]URM86557.1 hypothetical protein PBI_HILLTOPFARM_119 [Mycobacterium phage Hilltopfarm]